MPRISALTDAAASPEAQAIFAAIKSKIGMVPNLYRTTGHNPAVLGALLGLGDALGKGSFSAKDREAIALAVAETNSCDYCASAHVAISGSLKVPAGDIADHRKATSADPRLAGILGLAHAVADKRGKLTDADLAAARGAGLSEADIVETIGVVVANVFTNYLNHAFETDIDFPVVRTHAA